MKRRRVPKIIPTLKDNVLTSQIRMFARAFAQTGDVASVEQFYRATKARFFNQCAPWTAVFGAAFCRLHSFNSREVRNLDFAPASAYTTEFLDGHEMQQ